MTRLFVIPHTEATHHIEGRVGGWFDSELTARGRDQARRTAQRIADIARQATVVYTSDLMRAKQTAEPIADLLGVEIIESDDLREVGCGIAEGKPQEWLDKRIAHPPRNGSPLDHQIIEGAESRRSVATRISRFVKQLDNQAVDQTVIVSHGFASSFLIAAWIGMPVEAMGYVKFNLSAGGITTLDVNQTWRNRVVVELDSTSHLDVD